MDNMQEAFDNKKAKSIKTEIVGFSEKNLQDVLLLEEKCLPPDWQYEDAEDYYGEILANPNNINIFLKKEEKAVGYILARPHNEAIKEISEYDPELKEKDSTFYIETIQILPDCQGIGGGKRLLLAVCEEANRRGVNNFSIHARTVNKFHDKIKKIFEGNMILTRKIDSWQPAAGEPYEYIEWKY